MQSRNEAGLLWISLLVTVGLLGFGYWAFTNFISPPPPASSSSTPTTSEISIGEKVLVTTNTNGDKQAGADAIARGDFPTAVSKFQASLRSLRNDPEALIYLNNARVAKSNHLKIAVSVPIGKNANVSQEILRGVAQAQDEVNKGGGLQLLVAIANDNNDPNTVHQVATEFVRDSKILAVVGHNASNASISAAPVYQQAGLVMISPTSTAQSLSGMGKFIFRTVPSVSTEAENVSNYILKTAAKKNILLCLDSKGIYSQSFQDAFTKAVTAAGGSINSTTCELSASDFNPNTIISNARSTGADALVLSPDVDRINKATEIAQANKQQLPLYATSTMYTYQTLQTGQNDVNGMILAVPWHPEAIANSTFVQNARRLWGGNVNWRSATAYDATIAIAKALQQKNTREELQQLLHSPTFSVNGATGTIQFQSSGDIKSSSILVQIRPNPQTPTGYDFTPLKPLAP